MTFDQTAVVAIIVGVLALFVFSPLRHDVVAFIALAVAVAVGVVPADRAFAGFAHPATVTVAFVLILSRALSNTGAIDALVKVVTPASRRPSLQVAGFGSLAAPLSALMNNVGALALLMPAAVRAATKAKLSPATLLMPLSFASILGGLVTLIGTPPNALLASFLQNTSQIQIDFFTWMLFGVPPVLVMLPIAWLLLTRVIFSARDIKIGDSGGVIRDELAALGYMSKGERAAAIVFVCAALGWILRRQLAGWSGLAINDTVIALLAAIVLFAWPLSREKG